MQLYRAQQLLPPCTIHHALRRFEITVGIAWVIIVVGKRLPVIQKVLNAFHRDSKAQSLAKGQFHIRHAHHFSFEVKEWSTAITRIDLGCGLHVKFARNFPSFGAQIPSVTVLSSPNGLPIAKTRSPTDSASESPSSTHENFGAFLSSIFSKVRSANLFIAMIRTCLYSLAIKLRTFAVVNLDGNLCFALDDVEIGDQIAILINDESGS